VLLITCMPLPHGLRKKVYAILTSHVVTSQMFRTGSIVGVMLLAMFLIDMRESFKYQSLSHSAHDHAATSIAGSRLQEYYQYQSQYFRAQRNYYLSGFSLFLLVVLYRWLGIVSIFLREQDNADVVKKQALNQGQAVDVILKELNALKQREKEFLEASKRVEKAQTSETSLKTQAENNQTQFMKQLEINRQLELQIKRLTDQITSKSGSEKKDD